MAGLLSADLDYILNETRELWSFLRGTRLFLTGGTGFVGTWLVESFVHANRQLGLNAQLFLLSRNPEAFRTKSPQAAADPAIVFVPGSLSDCEIPTGTFPYVIHAATDQLSNPTPEEPAGTFDRELLGTRRILELARQCRTGRFLFTSSGAVYGPQPQHLTHIPEEYEGAPSTVDPHSGYGHAKRASEFLCTMYGRQYGFATIIARLFAFAGPYLPLDINFAVGNFIRDVLAGGPIRISGDGTPRRSYLYAADLAIWLWTVLIKGESARPYNVGSPLQVSIAELAHQVVENTVPGIAVEIAKKPVPAAPIARYVPSVDRVRIELGLEGKVPLNEAIRRTYRWNLAVRNSRRT